jgi:hypothetical protein
MYASMLHFDEFQLTNVSSALVTVTEANKQKMWKTKQRINSWYLVKVTVKPQGSICAAAYICNKTHQASCFDIQKAAQNLYTLNKCIYNRNEISGSKIDAIVIIQCKI